MAARDSLVAHLLEALAVHRVCDQFDLLWNLKLRLILEMGAHASTKFGECLTSIQLDLRHNNLTGKQMRLAAYCDIFNTLHFLENAFDCSWINLFTTYIDEF